MTHVVSGAYKLLSISISCLSTNWWHPTIFSKPDESIEVGVKPE